jgi:hypothetical protein
LEASYLRFVAKDCMRLLVLANAVVERRRDMREVGLRVGVELGEATCVVAVEFDVPQEFFVARVSVHGIDG